MSEICLMKKINIRSKIVVYKNLLTYSYGFDTIISIKMKRLLWNYNNFVDKKHL